MFIDIHVHAARAPMALRGGKPWLTTPEQLIERYDNLGIERAVLLPIIDSAERYVAQSNEEVLEIRDTYPDRFVAFCNLDPRGLSDPEGARLRDILAYYREHGCKGVGEITANIPFMHPAAQKVFRCVQETGWPLTFHISAGLGEVYGLYDDPGLPQLERCLQLYPNLRFLGHSQAFWAEMAPLETLAERYGYPQHPIREEGVVPKLFRRYKNLLGDLSASSGYNALARDPDHAVRFLDEFQDRLFFGTDICQPDTPVRLVEFLTSLCDDGRISEEILRKVARQNAVKLLGLEAEDTGG